MSWTIRSGRRDRPPMGVTPTPDGAEVAVFSDHAERITLCLFDAANREVARLPLPDRDGGVWHGFVPCLGPGARYGFRAHGPKAFEAGHRFNPAKLLLDPYARAIDGPVVQHRALSDRNGEDSARFVPRSVIPPPDAFDWGDDRPPRRPMADTVIYEAHAKGLTAAHPAIPPRLRGTYDALAHPALIDHLTALGVTAVELLPVHAFIDEGFLARRGLTNYWGYNTLG
ncbi:MAG: glycogen debranching enzyme, partial [Pseudomonadota bacterium]